MTIVAELTDWRVNRLLNFLVASVNIVSIQSAIKNGYERDFALLPRVDAGIARETVDRAIERARVFWNR